MIPRTPRERLAAVLWLVLAIFIGNGIYDVLVARGMPTVTGERALFDEVWARRLEIEASGGVSVFLPCIDDLITTKRFGARPKDAEDIRLLQRIKARSSS